MEDIRDVFAVVSAAGNASAKMHQERVLRRDIAGLEKQVCGNCCHWMKSSCVPEKTHGKFKSCNSLGCPIFEPKPYTLKLIAEKENKIQELRKSNEA